jgi:FkbM family methyltransferase
MSVSVSSALADSATSSARPPIGRVSLNHDPAATLPPVMAPPKSQEAPPNSGSPSVDDKADPRRPTAVAAAGPALSRPQAITLGDLRRCYRNWLSIALALKLGRPSPSRTVLRDGTVLGRAPGRGRVFALADAVRRGWGVRGGPAGCVTVVPSPGIDLDCRWERGYDLENAIEVFGDQVYRAPVGRRWVIDVGAGTGDAALYFAREGATVVVAIEPLPESQGVFRRNVGRSRYADRIRLIPAALAGTAGRRTLRFPREVPGAASLEPAADAAARWSFGEEVEVAVLPLAGVIPPETSGLGMLKLDCQGAEYEILRTTPSAVLDRFETIIVEFTNGAGPLRDRLQASGFHVDADEGSRGYLRAHRLG